jgi:adenylate cyclase
MADHGPYLEIERKFLVHRPWPTAQTVQSIRQIYINPGASTSVRLRESDGSYTLTLKRGRSAVTRSEYNMPVDPAQGAQMLAEFTTNMIIEKQRHILPLGDATWEIDVFTGTNAGLIVAEIELQHEAQPFSMPNWLGREVSNDPRFTNHALFINPFGRWGLTYAELLE